MSETNLVSYLQRKVSCFTITIRNTELASYIKQSLLSAPHVTSLIKGMSYSSSANLVTGETRISFNIQYDKNISQFPTYLVSNELEIMTALSLMYRFHSSIVKIVVDNSKGIITSENAFLLFDKMKKMVDEELQLAQLSRSTSSYISFAGRSVYVYTLQNDYFDSEKPINDMSCAAAQLAHSFVRECNYNQHSIIMAIQRWFRENIQYKNNNITADHSAVGLIRNKTGVCQAIAAYAYQLLTYSGFQARYVSGQGNGSGGWGPHGWNMVRINGAWQHIDFTFELHKLNPVLPRPINEFRLDHRWDEQYYSAPTSDNYVQTRQALDRSIIVTIPNNPCYSVNGCIVDTSEQSLFCIIHHGIIYVLVFELVKVCGGCYVLKDHTVHMYIDTHEYGINLQSLLYHKGAWYIQASQLSKYGYKLDISGQRLILQYSPRTNT